MRKPAVMDDKYSMKAADKDDADELRGLIEDAENELVDARKDLEVANKLVHELVDVLGLDELDMRFVKQALTPPNSGDARRGVMRALERAGWTRRR